MGIKRFYALIMTAIRNSLHFILKILYENGITQNVPFGIDLDGSFKSPDIFAPAIMPEFLRV